MTIPTIIPTTPAGVVTDKFNTVNEFREVQETNLTEFIDSLDEYINGIASPIVTAGDYTWEDIATARERATRPDSPDLSYELPEAPANPDLNTRVSNNLEYNLYQLNREMPSNAAEKPSLNMPDRFTVTWPSAPSDPPDSADIPTPTAPEYEKSEMPTIEQLSIDDVPNLSLPSFSVSVPAFAPIENLRSFEYNLPDDYYSALAELIKAKLANDVENGGTGLGSTIETALWTRARERQQEINEQKYLEATDYWSSRGFALPPGALAGALAQVSQEISRADAQLNYEISIEQARLADQNTRWAVDTGVLFEKHLMDHYDGWAMFTLEAAKAAQTMAIETYRIRIMQFEATLAGINAKIAVYQGQIQANAAILEQYRVKAEIVKTNAGLQELNVRIWETVQKTNAVRADIYRTEMEAARIQATIEAQKLESHKLKVDIYTAITNANTAQYGAYTAQIDGEKAKIEIYSEEIKAYLAEVEVFKSKQDQLIKSSQAELEVNRYRLDEFRAKLLRYEAELKGELGRLQAETDVYKSDAAMYSADLDREKTALLGDIESYKAKMEHERNNLQISLRESELTGAYKIEEFKMKIQALQAKVAFANQMIASALSAVSASAQISAQASESRSFDQSQRYSESTNVERRTDGAVTQYLPSSWFSYTGSGIFE